MATILDQHGNPIERAALAEPQTSRVALLQNVYLEGQLDGLTPARAARILRQADEGDLVAQAQLFDDMLDRDAHLAGEFDKRRGALLAIDWSVEAPTDATAAEKRSAAWVEEILRDVVDDFEDVLLACMDGVGHGFSAIELEWQRREGEWIPAFHPRPQTWFQLSSDRRALRLRDGSFDGATPWSFGWIIHQHKKAKTGYLGRMGLLRPLVWPFIYRAYAIGDLAEFLDIYGLPMIVGKYMSAATADEKASLMAAVTALGHDARAIMPQDMAIEIQKITGSGDGAPHMEMIEWAEKAISKAVLGATLTTQADGSKSTNALGRVHNEVRRDIRRADCRQVADTLTRDLIYPLIALNQGGIDGLRRCPRLRFDLGEAEDIQRFAEALPALASGGARIPIAWVHERLRIPMAADDQPVFSPPQPAFPPAVGTAALSMTAPHDPTPVDAHTERLAGEAAPAMADWLARINAVVAQAESLEALRDALAAAFGDLPTERLSAVMEIGFAAADLAGRFDANEGR